MSRHHLIATYCTHTATHLLECAAERDIHEARVVHSHERIRHLEERRARVVRYWRTSRRVPPKVVLQRRRALVSLHQQSRARRSAPPASQVRTAAVYTGDGREKNSRTSTRLLNEFPRRSMTNSVLSVSTTYEQQFSNVSGGSCDQPQPSSSVVITCSALGVLAGDQTA